MAKSTEFGIRGLQHVPVKVLHLPEVYGEGHAPGERYAVDKFIHRLRITRRGSQFCHHLFQVFFQVIVGEDLGIVPGYVRPAMARHGFHRMYILHYELADNTTDSIGRMPRNAVASLNTHDMPPFASFWQNLDIEERLSLGLVDAKGARAESRTRRVVKASLTSMLRNNKFLPKARDGVRDALNACLSFLGAGRARVVLVNLEDLWLETKSQNVPSTGDAYPSWQKKARYTLEEFYEMPKVRDTLEAVKSARRRKNRQIKHLKKTKQ